MTDHDLARKNTLHSDSTILEPEESLIVTRPPAAAAMPRLGRYRLICEIASGGMAQVYLAVADGLDKLVALKVVHPHLAREDNFVRMFLDEARIASRINHRNVCSVFDYGEDNGHYFMAMDFLAGKTLRDVVRRLRGKRPSLGTADIVAFVTTLIADAADGLHAAHELHDAQGEPLQVVHRDVSPHNLFVTYEGMISVIDFGIAHAQDRLQNTATGILKGKFSYMAPEQIRDKDVDRRVDVWALGVCLWECLTQRRLFARDSQADTLMSVMSDVIKPPSAHFPEIPATLDAIVGKALARNPQERYATARELSRELRAFLRSESTLLGSEDMEQRMHALFPAECVESEQALRNARKRASASGDLLSGKSLLGISLPSQSGTGFRPIVLGDTGTLSGASLSSPSALLSAPALPLGSTPEGARPSLRLGLEDAPGRVSMRAEARGILRRGTHLPWFATALVASVAVVSALVGRNSVATNATPALTSAPERSPTPSPAPVATLANETHDPPSSASSAPGSAASTAAGATATIGGLEPSAGASGAVRPVAPAPAATAPLLASQVAALRGPRTWLPVKPARPTNTPSPTRDVAALEAPRVRATETHDEVDASASAVAAPERESAAHQREPLTPAATPVGQAARPAVAPVVTAAPRAPLSFAGAHAAFSVTAVHGAIGSSTVLRMLSRATPLVESCFQARAAGSSSTALAPLDASLTIDENGRVSASRAGTHPVSGLGACVEGALRKLRSEQKPDVGTVTADVQITFRLR